MKYLIITETGCPSHRSGTSAITNERTWSGCSARSLTKRQTRRSDDGSDSILEYGDRRDAGGHLSLATSKRKDSGSVGDAPTALWRRTFPHRQGSLRTTLHQSPHFAGLPRSKGHSLHAVCWQDPLQGLGS